MCSKIKILSRREQNNLHFNDFIKIHFFLNLQKSTQNEETSKYMRI